MSAKTDTDEATFVAIMSHCMSCMGHEPMQITEHGWLVFLCDCGLKWKMKPDDPK